MIISRVWINRFQSAQLDEVSGEESKRLKSATS